MSCSRGLRAAQPGAELILQLAAAASRGEESNDCRAVALGFDPRLLPRSSIRGVR
jgi:hypothetical protein